MLVEFVIKSGGNNAFKRQQATTHSRGATRRVVLVILFVVLVVLEVVLVILEVILGV